MWEFFWFSFGAVSVAAIWYFKDKIVALKDHLLEKMKGLIP